MDPLAGIVRAGAANGRKSLLHGVSVHAGARYRAPVASGEAAAGREWLRNKWLPAVLLLALSSGLMKLTACGTVLC